MAVVSDDHADESYNVTNLTTGDDDDDADQAVSIRLFRSEEINEHNNNSNSGSTSDESSSFWAVIDGFVVDASDFINKHPGGRKKILSTNDVATGYTQTQPFEFSFSKGHNAHFPGTAKIFREGIEKYLNGGSPVIEFPGEYKNEVGGKLVVLGRLQQQR